MTPRLITGSAQGVVASLMSNSGQSGDAKGDTFDGIENLTGSTHADALVGDDGVNTLIGSEGDDLLFGLGDADTLDGGDGLDTLDGGKGIDKMLGGADDDTYVVNAGDEVVEKTARARWTGCRPRTPMRWRTAPRSRCWKPPMRRPSRR